MGARGGVTTGAGGVGTGLYGSTLTLKFIVDAKPPSWLSSTRYDPAVGGV
jgi:hypothetical protein